MSTAVAQAGEARAASRSFWPSRRVASRAAATRRDSANPACRRRTRPRPRPRTGTPAHRRCGYVSNGGPIDQIRCGVGCDILIRCLHRSPKHPNHLGRLRSSLELRWAATRKRPSHPRQTPGPGRHGQRPGASESQDSVGRAAARGAAGRCSGCTHRNRGCSA